MAGTPYRVKTHSGEPLLYISRQPVSDPQGEFEVLGVGSEFPLRYRAAVEAVTADDVLRAATRYLTNLTTVVLRPPPAR